MDLLINIKKSEDINRYIKYIEQKIKIAEDNNNLSEVKDLLKNKNFLEALYLYILDKKYKNEVPLLLEYANDIINDILELYVPLKEKIDKLVLDTNKSISINDMNTWLKNLFLIYKKHGKEITINDFKEIFPKSMEDDNKLIFEYMSIYFKNINNKDESIYNDAIFKYCTLSDDMNNPILNIMGKAIDTLNQKEDSVLLKKGMSIFLGISVSIDALVIGFTLMSKISMLALFINSVFVGLITFIICYIGFVVSDYIKKLDFIERYASFLGGIILIIMALKMIFF